MKKCKNAKKNFACKVFSTLIAIALGLSLFANYKFVTFGIAAKDKNPELMEYFPACYEDLTLMNLLFNAPKE